MSVKYEKEFQVALDLSSIIEEENNIEIPFDEIGFISMFYLLMSVKKKELQKIMLVCSSYAWGFYCLKYVENRPRTFRNVNRNSDEYAVNDGSSNNV